MNWQFNLLTVPIIFSALIAISLAIYAWRKRAAGPWVLPFVLLATALAIWSLGYALELASQTAPAKIFWVAVEYIGIVTTPVAWFLFAMQYSGRRMWRERRYVAPLFVIPVITMLLVFTNDAHNLIWTQFGLTTSDGLLILDNEYGTWFWVHSVYSYILILSGTIVLMGRLRRFPAIHSWQIGVLVLAPVVPLLANGLYLSGLGPFPQLDPTPSAFTVSGIIFAWGIFRLQLFKIGPVARRTVVDNMSDGMIVLNLENQIMDVNPAATEILGKELDEIMGRPIELFLTNGPKLIDQFGKLSQENGEIVLDIEEKGQWYDIHISPIHDRRQNLRGRVFVLRNITERKRAEAFLTDLYDQALAANSLKSKILARVSHELRTPLGIITLYAEMLQYSKKFQSLPEESQGALNKIIVSADDLTFLIEELLIQSKLDADTLALKMGIFSPAALLKKVHSQMNLLAEQKGLVLSVNVASDFPEFISGDMNRIQQILVNLVGNAIKFTKEGSVQVDFCRHDHGFWAMRVSDTGPGITGEEQAFIFDPFRQGEHSKDDSRSGIGLGLSIVKQLVDLMDGRVIIESEIGQGSTFTVLLPLDEHNQ